MGQYPNYRPYYIPQISGWGPSVAPLPPPPPPLQPAPYVDHQSAKKIKNDVNVHKDTIRLQVDEQSPDCHLVSFTFDALVDGRFVERCLTIVGNTSFLLLLCLVLELCH
ncbi:UNVERIFIED_CONTAM: putative E3 ubiquitin-protein ligase LUL4 [Sesamum radiatum]|uniref:RING-type E3 ubiquitin transferase n=1 Tax=Sesamum radiatum TaxID=300843 RepID=A0AAW2U9W0_SESRA